MVDDLDDFGLLDAVDRLAYLVVVDEHHLALRAHGHVRARDDADGAPLVVEHDGLAQRASHEVLDGLFQQAVLAEHEHVGFRDVLHPLPQRGDEVARDGHLVRAAFLERVGGGDVALGDHARGDEAAVRAVVVRHDERAHVVLAQQAPRLEQGGVVADGDGIGRHDIGHARVHVGDDVGGGDAVPLEDPGGLRRQGAEADGTVDAGRLFGILRPAGKLVLQIRVAHRCADRIVVRVLMAHDDDRCRHCCTPYPRALTRGAPLTLQSCGCSLRPRCGAARLPRTPSIAGRAKRVSPDQPFRAQMSRKSQKAPARDGRTRP